MEEIDRLKARVRELEGDPVVHLLCPRCGREVRPDDVYCRTAVKSCKRPTAVSGMFRL